MTLEEQILLNEELQLFQKNYQIAMKSVQSNNFKDAKFRFGLIGSVALKIQNQLRKIVPDEKYENNNDKIVKSHHIEA